MKKIACTMILFLLTSGLFAAGKPDILLQKLNQYNLSALVRIKQKELPRLRIAVAADMQKITGTEAVVDPGEMLSSSLSATGRFVFLERSKINKIFEEQKMSAGGLFDESTIPEIGAMIGADYVLISKIISSSTQLIERTAWQEREVLIRLQITIVDASTGEVFYSVEGSGTANTRIIIDSSGKVYGGSVNDDALAAQAVRSAVDSLLPGIKLKFPLICFVLKNENGNLLIDSGAQYGITEGKKVVIIRPGELITHPVTGAVIGLDYTVLCYATVSETKNNSALLLMDKVKKDAIPVVPGDIAVYID